MKAKRLTRRQLARMTAAERRSYDALLYGMPGLVERAEHKTLLGMRRTREETVALARKLLADGLGRVEVADRLRVDVRYVDRTLMESETAEIGREKHSVCSGFVRLTDTPKVIPYPNGQRRVYGGDPFAYDLSAALEETA